MRALLTIALVVLLLAGCGGDDADEAAAPDAVTVTEVVTETEPETETDTETETGATTTEETGSGCSASGLRLTLPEQDLPDEVASVRRRIFDAAIACDYETLEKIALERGEGFTFSYGGGTDASAYWREVEGAGAENPLPMRALATILTLPYTRNESGSYAWPSAYSENPTEDAWRDLVYAGLYSAEEVDRMETQGTGYLGYRTAITPAGDWQFFVAGD